MDTFAIAAISCALAFGMTLALLQKKLPRLNRFSRPLKIFASLCVPAAWSFGFANLLQFSTVESFLPELIEVLSFNLLWWAVISFLGFAIVSPRATWHWLDKKIFRCHPLTYPPITSINYIIVICWWFAWLLFLMLLITSIGAIPLLELIAKAVLCSLVCALLLALLLNFLSFLGQKLISAFQCYCNWLKN